LIRSNVAQSSIALAISTTQKRQAAVTERLFVISNYALFADGTIDIQAIPINKTSVECQ
jgi:hypothetical protein